MTPYFKTWQSLIDMGGYGPFVWTCYAITFIILFVLIWQSLARKKRIFKLVNRETARQERIKQAKRSGDQL